MHSAAILSGGRATRFGGRDKGALVVDGRTIRARQLAVLAEVAGDVMIVAGADAWGAEALAKAAAPPIEAGTARIVRDRVENGGPLAGVEAALAGMRGDAVFVVACDMPYIAAPLAAHLLALARDADIVVPYVDGRYHPLCAVYARACLDAVTRRLERGHVKMADLFDDVRTRVVAADEIERFGDRYRLLANVNTPVEYEGLEALPVHES